MTQLSNCCHKPVHPAHNPCDKGQTNYMICNGCQKACDPSPASYPKSPCCNAATNQVYGRHICVECGKAASDPKRVEEIRRYAERRTQRGTTLGAEDAEQLADDVLYLLQEIDHLKGALAECNGVLKDVLPRLDLLSGSDVNKLRYRVIPAIEHSDAALSQPVPPPPSES